MHESNHAAWGAVGRNRRFACLAPPGQRGTPILAPQTVGIVRGQSPISSFHCVRLRIADNLQLAIQLKGQNYDCDGNTRRGRITALRIWLPAPGITGGELRSRTVASRAVLPLSHSRRRPGHGPVRSRAKPSVSIRQFPAVSVTIVVKTRATREPDHPRSCHHRSSHQRTRQCSRQA